MGSAKHWEGGQYLEHNILKEKYETYSRSERKQFFGE